MSTLALLVPCYNEEDILSLSCNELLSLLRQLAQEGAISENSSIYLVDDGSQDSTWQLICQLSEQHQEVKGIRLARNFGHQNALLAGLMHCKEDWVISLDADMQDDISVIPNMLIEAKKGTDIVYGVRNDRQSDTAFKRWSAKLFYRFMHTMGTKIIDDHADFRLLNRKALDELKKFKEVNLFLRGLVPMISANSSVVYYSRKARTSGDSKYPITRMLGLALDGITSFSIVPLRMISILGFVIFAITSGMSLWVLWSALFDDSTVPGWASTVLPAYFLGGVQILCLGVIGEYLGKIYAEVKNRPRYSISETLE